MCTKRDICPHFRGRLAGSMKDVRFNFQLGDEQILRTFIQLAHYTCHVAVHTPTEAEGKYVIVLGPVKHNMPYSYQQYV